MRTIFLSVLAVSVVAGAAALAQTQTDTTAAPAMSQPATSQASPPLSAPSVTPNFISLEATDMLSSNVVGLDVRNDQNADVGKIQDIAFDGSKTVKGYILSVGGFLGVGTHYVAVQPEAVMIKYDVNGKTWRASINATKDQLKAAPEFKYGGQWSASRS